MARSRSTLSLLAVLALAAYISAPVFVSPARTTSQVDAIAPATVALGAAVPLTVATPAFAYDSVVSYLQAWLFGGTFLVLFFVLVLVASIANPLTLRREEAERI
mmetsp:Transcript_94044/g.130615  ORF Transcript_94044/g.130615 Transcript_94044/m.130615 type:complete len:104 (-) Transcript_94044:46-357(-)